MSSNDKQNSDHLKQRCFDLLCFTKQVCESNNVWYSLAAGTMLGAVRHEGYIPWDSDVDIFVKLPDKQAFRDAIRSSLKEGVALDDFDIQPHNLQSHDVIRYVDDTDNAHVDIYYLCGAPSDEKEQARFAFISSYTDRIIRSKYNRIKDCKKKNRKLVFCAKVIDYCIPDSVLKKYTKHKELKYDYEKSEYVMPLANWGNATACIPKVVFEKMTQQPFNGELFAIPRMYDVYLSRTYGEDYMIPKKY